MKEVILTNGMRAIVDDSDYDLVMFGARDESYKYAHSKPLSWQPQYGHNKIYARTRIRVGLYTSKTLYMHRLIMGVQKTSRPFVDHINHNGLDNTRANLRLCECWQNNANNRRRNGTKSKYKGVRLLESGRWAAEIRGKAKNSHLGVFNNEEDAARAYNAEAIKVFGEFASPNKIQEVAS